MSKGSKRRRRDDRYCTARQEEANWRRWRNTKKKRKGKDA